jgi:hypothetical protein
MQTYFQEKNMIEQWTKWEPIQGLASKCFKEIISDSLKGFKIVLSDVHNKKKKIVITIECLQHSYKVTNVRYKTQLFRSLENQYGKDFFDKWVFFKVTNSQYLKLLSVESHTISDDRKLQHFAIICSNVVIDIIDGFDPSVELIEEK